MQEQMICGDSPEFEDLIKSVQDMKEKPMQLIGKWILNFLQLVNRNDRFQENRNEMKIGIQIEPLGQ